MWYRFPSPKRVRRTRDIKFSRSILNKYQQNRKKQNNNLSFGVFQSIVTQQLRVWGFPTLGDLDSTKGNLVPQKKIKKNLCIHLIFTSISTLTLSLFTTVLKIVNTVYNYLLLSNLDKTV